VIANGRINNGKLDEDFKREREDFYRRSRLASEKTMTL